MDVDNIPAGVDFIDHINSQVAACDIFLAIIGPSWLNATDEKGNRRIFASDDFVVIEIAAALARDIRVIPVLIDGARMPKASELPEPLMALVRRNAFEMRHSHFGRDAEALIARIREALSNNSIGSTRWLTAIVAGMAAVLLLVSWIGLYGRGVPASLRWVLQPDRERSAAPIAEDHKAKTPSDAEAAAKAEQAERERMAAVKAEQDRKAKAAADAAAEANTEAWRKFDEMMERQRLGAQTAAPEDTVRVEQDRNTKAAADPEALRKFRDDVVQRLGAQGPELQQQFVGTPAVQLGCQGVHAQSDNLRFDIVSRTAAGMRAIRFRVYNTDIVIQKVIMHHEGDVEFALQQSSLYIASSAASARISVENHKRPLSLVVVNYTARPIGSSEPQSLCLEGLN